MYRERHRWRMAGDAVFAGGGDDRCQVERLGSRYVDRDEIPRPRVGELPSAGWGGLLLSLLAAQILTDR